MNFILAPSTTRDLDRLSQYFLETLSFVGCTNDLKHSKVDRRG
ncbi:hypothetical protein [Chamaesiphon sp. VAR_48_metabat_403]|nr:hypothetical protein [Chamaesiphon sp. VAR_48_metabat_403]